MLKTRPFSPFIIVMLAIIAAWPLPCSAEWSGQTDSVPSGAAITIAAVGDIMMGSDYPAQKLPPQGVGFLFQDVKEILTRADLAFGNLEGPLCDGGTPEKKFQSGRSYCFRTPTRFVRDLAEAGFGVVSLANNHAMDFGTYGSNATRKALSGAGIKFSAGGQVVDLEIKGLKLGIIAFSFSSGSSAFYETTLKQIESHSKSYDIFIVSIHGGKEGLEALHTKNEFEYFLGEPRGNLVEFSHQAIDRGAALIIAHGPHVPRALELYKGRIITYSLGNFCTYGGMNLNEERGYAPLLWVELDKDGRFLSGKVFSFIQNSPGGPRWDEKKSAYKLMKILSEQDFPDSNPFANLAGPARDQFSDSTTKSSSYARSQTQ